MAQNEILLKKERCISFPLFLLQHRNIQKLHQLTFRKTKPKTKDKCTNKFHFCRQTKLFSTKLQLIRAQKKSIYRHHRFLCKQTFSSQNEKSGRQKALLDTFANKGNACELNSFRIFALCCRALPLCAAQGRAYTYLHRHEKTFYSPARLVCSRHPRLRSARGGAGGRRRNGRAHSVCQPLLQRHTDGHAKRRRGALRHCLPTRATLRLIGGLRFARRPTGGRRRQPHHCSQIGRSRFR